MQKYKYSSKHQVKIVSILPQQQQQKQKEKLENQYQTNTYNKAYLKTAL